MTETTLIRIDIELKKKLDDFKIIPRESYGSAIMRLFKQANKGVRPRNYNPVAKAKNLSAREEARMNNDDDWENDDSEE